MQHIALVPLLQVYACLAYDCEYMRKIYPSFQWDTFQGDMLEANSRIITIQFDYLNTFYMVVYTQYFLHTNGC